MASSLSHLEEFANVTSREPWCKHTERQTVAQPAKATRRFMCQGVGNGLRTSSIERNCQANHVMWCNRRSLVVQLKRSFQAINVCKSSKNRSNNMRQSWNPVQHHHSHPVRVTKSRCKSTRRVVRARIPESDTRTVDPRLEMSTLISELCERGVPEIDWEKFAVDCSSVYDIYTGLGLDEAQVKAGRETEVKSMLEFEVYEEVSEEQARGKRIWNSAWLDSQTRPGLVRSISVVNQVRGACMREDVFAASPPLAAMRFIFVPCCLAWSWPLPRLVGCVCGTLPCSD